MSALTSSSIQVNGLNFFVDEEKEGRGLHIRFEKRARCWRVLFAGSQPVYLWRPEDLAAQREMKRGGRLLALKSRGDATDWPGGVLSL
jgi:hypothetical protein